jgi:hypothetical protein
MRDPGGAIGRQLEPGCPPRRDVYRLSPRAQPAKIRQAAKIRPRRSSPLQTADEPLLVRRRIRGRGACGGAWRLCARPDLPFGAIIHILRHMAASIAPPSLVPLDTATPAFSDTPISNAETTAMFRAVVNLFRLWGVSDGEAAVLLDLPPRTFARWKAEGVGRLGRDGRARLSNLMGIHKALRLIFADPVRGYGWIKAPNAAFGGKPALAVMLGGELADLMRVRRYLDAERGAW